MHIGISTLIDLDQPLDSLVVQIAAAGFTHVSLSHNVEHAGYHLPGRRQALRKLLAELGLKLNYIHAPLERYYDLTSLNPQVRRASIEIMKICIEASAELGGDGVVLHVMNGMLDEGDSLKERVAAGIGSLKELAACAKSLKVRISAENLPLSLDCGVVSLAVLRALGKLKVGICLDACHASMNTPSGMPLMQELAPRVWHTHLSDTRGGHDSHLIPGAGSVDFPAVAWALGQAGFDGVVDLECSLWMLRYRKATGQLAPGDPPASDIAWITTAQYLEQAAQAARWIGGMIEKARG
jgi:sugar phosphate isomerase/epimerase